MPTEPLHTAVSILCVLYPDMALNDPAGFSDAISELEDDAENGRLSAWEVVTIDGDDWYIVDESDRETMWDDVLQSYLDDCLLPTLPEHARYYFDDEKWKQDARFDGAGHAISSHDGNEHEIQLTDGTWMFAYRC